MAPVQSGFRISIDVDRPEGSYYPDDEVRGTITIESDKEIKVREVRAGLVYSQQYQMRITSGKRLGSRWDTEENWISQEVLAVDVIPAKFNRTYDFNWRIPPDAQPACAGTTVRNRWLVKVQLDRPLTRDIVAEVELPLVVPPQGIMTQGGMYGEQIGTGAAHMSFQLPKLEFVDGETLNAELTIGPHENFEVREIRVELVRVEHVLADDGRSKSVVEEKVQLAGKTTFEAETPVEYNFSLPIATNGRPSHSGLLTEVDWMLRAVVDIPRVEDSIMEKELFLYNGPHRV